MGEMADMCLDWEINGWDRDYDGERSLSFKTCNRCGAPNLHWVNIGTYVKPVWRLFEPNNTQHNCMLHLKYPNYYTKWAAEVPYLRWARGFKYNLHKYKCSTSH